MDDQQSQDDQTTQLQGAVINVDPLEPVKQEPDTQAQGQTTKPQDQDKAIQGAQTQEPQSPATAEETDPSMQKPKQLDAQEQPNEQDLPKLSADTKRPSQLQVEKKQSEVKLPSINDDQASPVFFGYKPPKWAHDFDFVRKNKGKGKSSEAKTWLLYTVDRILKTHSI